MKKFIIRNDDVAFDTSLAEIQRFCNICDTYGYKIIQAIVPIGEIKKITSSRMSNNHIRNLSSRLFGENKEVLRFLQTRQDSIAVHGLWHTHKPSEQEIQYAISILSGLGLKPTYYVPPFNEGNYPDEVCGLRVSKLSMKNGERLEDFLEDNIPQSEIMYLHSWRFDNAWYSFDKLEQCLKRLQNHL